MVRVTAAVPWPRVPRPAGRQPSLRPYREGSYGAMSWPDPLSDARGSELNSHTTQRARTGRDSVCLPPGDTVLDCSTDAGGVTERVTECAAELL